MQLAQRDTQKCQPMRNYDFVFPHYIHEVLTHREGDKVILTENEYTKKLLIIQTLDGKDEVLILW